MRRVLVIAAFAFVVLGMFPAAAVAATCRNTLVVDDPGDSAVATAGQLRTAISEVCNDGKVILQRGLVITLAQGQLVIPTGKSITIRGSAIIDANAASRVIWVEIEAALILRSVTVQNGTDAGIFSEGSLAIVGGRVSDSAGPGIINHGTAVLMRDTVVAGNQGSGILNIATDLVLPPAGGFLTLEDKATVTGNTATSGGGIFNAGGVTTLNENSSVTSNTAATTGGGILNAPSPFSDSVLTLNDNARVTGNTAPFGAGIFHEFTPGQGAITVLNDQSRISNNVGIGVSGRDSLTLNDDSHISSNSAAGVDLVNAGVVLNDRSSVADNGGDGISIALTSLVTLNDESSILGNTGVGIRNLFQAEITLNGSSRISENDAGGVRNSPGSMLTLNGRSAISGNTSSQKGGGILNESATVVLNNNSRVVDNVAPLGGGIYNASGSGLAFVTLNDASSITGNTATAGQGGGVYNEPEATVTTNDSSSITGNIPDNCFPAIC